MAPQPWSGHGLLFEVSLILLDTWQNSFGRVINSSQRPLPLQDNTTYKHKAKYPCSEGIRIRDPSKKAAKTYALDGMVI
jgi:hypothetical protein